MIILLGSVGVFLAITLIILGAHNAVAAPAPAAERLKQMVPQSAPKAQAKSSSNDTSGVTRVLGTFGQFGFGQGDASVAHRLSAGGMRSRNAVTVFLGARTLLSFGPALIIVVPRISSGMPLGQTLWWALGSFAAGHLLPNYWLSTKAKKRVNQITKALPDTLDLMVVCLEAGLGLNSTIQRVAEERSSMNDPLGREFTQVAFEIRSGRGREEALRSLGARNGVDDLKSLSAIMIQSDRLGASMGATLRVHADLVRTRRRQRAEEAARKLPIKVLFPLATMLLPSLFVLVLGPAFLQLKNLMKLMMSQK